MPWATIMSSLYRPKFKISVSVELPPIEDWGRMCSRPLPELLAGTHNLRRPFVQPCVCSVSNLCPNPHPAFPWALCLFLPEQQPLNQGPPKPSSLILNWFHLQRPYFPRPYSQVPRVRTWTYLFLGDTIQPTIGGERWSKQKLIFIISPSRSFDCLNLVYILCGFLKL